MRSVGRRLAEFGVVCLVLTCAPLIWLVASGAEIGTGAGRAAFAVATFGPTLAAFVMWVRYRERHPGPRVRWSPGWPVAAVVLGAAAPFLAGLVSSGGDLAAIDAHSRAAIASAGGLAGALAFTLLAGPVSEEFGWRGYVQPWLRLRHGRLVTVLALGAMWGAWHVPLFLVPGTGQHELGLLTPGALIYFLEILPVTYLILFVSEQLRGGVPAAILLHAAWNLAGELVPKAGVPGQLIELGVVVGLALAVAGAAAVRGGGTAPAAPAAEPAAPVSPAAEPAAPARTS
ncbi:hypothetical protein GCM10009751_05550 [Myceligenerans crystallogenes]|uniref:CAAX prenyl protease 2/Lysostaphin resistance protein A-like domain-containing protein n=1 Tax=Myceligenerans crystallogenes TaxID=316335 RepID=A0ABP4ZCZ8_9MICO